MILQSSQTCLHVPSLLVTLLVTGTLLREDGRCGPDFPLANGIPAQCDGKGGGPCCSPSGWCGSTEAHCNSAACIDYRDVISDGECHSNKNLFSYK